MFGEPWSPPESDGSGQDRNILRRASQLLAAAGAKRGSDNVLRLADGTKMEVEFLEFDNAISGIRNRSSRTCAFSASRGHPRGGPSQFQKRQQEFDFDILSARFVMSMAPGESLRNLFGSQAAKTTARAISRDRRPGGG